MAKKVTSVIKLQVPGGQATPAPPVGPALAQHGLNIADFCKKFNDLTEDKKGSVIPVVVTVYEDKSYDFKVKQSLVSDLLKKAAAIEKGSGEPNKIKVGKITREQLRKIAEQKMADLNTDNIDAAMKIIEATAKNMGIEIQG